MKLIVTVGNDNGDSQELVFDVPEPITWLGVEIDDPRQGEDRSQTGRMTILRVPFHMHGKSIHSICSLNSDEVREVQW